MDEVRVVVTEVDGCFNFYLIHHLVDDCYIDHDQAVLGEYGINLREHGVGSRAVDYRKAFTGLMQFSYAFDAAEAEDLFTEFFEAGFRAGLAEGEKRIRQQIRPHVESLVREFENIRLAREEIEQVMKSI
jgi:hypothetical protein